MYLAMDWLEGEGLDARLARGPLAIGEPLHSLAVSLARSALWRRVGNLGGYGPVHLENGWRTAEPIKLAVAESVDPRALATR